MNKQNKILLGILAFILVCSIGYALFSESITITGTATAKGDFDISTTCKAGLDDFDSAYIESLGMSKEGGYANDVISCSNQNNITYSVDLLYPTATRYFVLKFTNTGSIPAIIPQAENVIKAELKVYNEDKSINQTNNLNSSIQMVLAVETADKQLITDKDKIQDFVYDNDFFKIEPNESIYYAVAASYGENDELLLPNNGYFTIDYQAQFIFTQITEE